jgi:prepilin-type N-terminal cleavage/methylation domain-containing protein
MTKLQVESCQLQVLSGDLPPRSYATFNFQPSAFNLRRAFTLVEVLVTLAILSIIILGMMEVFNHTQSAFRANLTQTDVLESGRDVMSLIRSDLVKMSPSFGQTNNVANNFRGAVNFYVTSMSYPSFSPFNQPLAGSSASRTNILEGFFILSRENVNGTPSWVGTGYAVVAQPPGGGLYSLYRFTTTPVYPVMSRGPEYAFYNNLLLSNLTNNWSGFIAAPTNYSHLMDGVVDLRVRAFDINGTLMNLQNWQRGLVTNKNVEYFTPPPQFDEGGFCMFSNTLPATVEVEMGVVEDRTLEHAESLEPQGGAAITNYLSDHAGQVHIFRQTVPIRNVDPAAYQ